MRTTRGCTLSYARPRQGLIANSGTIYRAHYERTINYPTAVSDHRLSSASVTLDAVPVLGSACTIEIMLSYEEAFGMTSRSGTFQETYPCSVVADPDSSLWIVEADGFSGTDDEVKNQFVEHVYGLGHPWEDASAYSEMVSPRLYLDPADTRVLGFAGHPSQLLEREMRAPPSP